MKPGADEARPGYVELRAALYALPLRDRQLLNALYWEGQTQREHARQIHVNQAAIVRRHARILATLRRTLREPATTFLPSTLSQWEIAVEYYTRQLSQKGRFPSVPPFPGWVQGRSWPDHQERGWGSPTWRCGQCRQAYPIRKRRCPCSISREQTAA
jgi:hypothetical protein